ncbi:MAG TPA: outer membrane beta-barrel protein [Candidatus Limnocylindrales bacterium]|nr:outer membrane beta-barrel protein [Candidatus Limnocylindrales bacterium]
MRRLGGLFSSTLLVGLLLGTGTASALPGDGASEVQVSAGFNQTQGSDTGSLNVDLSYGYYLTPGWQLGFRQAINSTFVDNGRDFWLATTTPFLNYNFRLTNIIVPYLGAFIGAAWNDRDITGTAGPQVGIKFFVHDNTFLNLGYRYDIFFSRIDTIDNNSSRGNHVANLGVGFTWGGAPSKP